MFPKTDNRPLLRTDFSDEDAWVRVRHAVQTAYPRPDGGFWEYVDVIDDPAFAGFDAEAVAAAVPGADDREYSVVFVVDGEALTRPDNAVLVVDLDEDHQPRRHFRAIPSALPGIDTNYLIAYIDLAVYADAVDDDGVFRDFRSGGH